MKKQKVILVGANHAGTASAKFLLKEPEKVDLTIYDKNSNISFLSCGMALWIGDQISRPDGLFYSSPEELESLGANVNLEAEVTKIDFDKKLVHVTLKDGTKITDNYDKLILGVGSRPILPPFPGLDLEGIQVAKLYQDAVKAHDLNQSDEVKKVAVVGAGYIGVELAEAFKRAGKEVLLIDLADRILSSHFDEEFSSIMQKRLVDNGVTMRLGESVQSFEGKDGKVTHLITDKGKYDVDLVILCIGFRPNADLAKDHLKTIKNGAILVDKHQKTSDKDVYAIGDCATVYNNSTDEVGYIALATNAVRSGIVAAQNILGYNVESNGVQGSSGLSIYGLKMVSTGLTLTGAERAGIEVLHTDYKATQKPEFMDEAGPNPEVFIRIVYRKDNREIVGASLISEYDISANIHMFSLAIQEKVTIDKLKLLDLFFMPHFNEPYNYITMAAIEAE